MNDAEIARLLVEAQAAHLRHREASPRMVATGGGRPVRSEGDPAAARAALLAAYDARIAAELLDPHGESTAWADDPHRALHYELLTFYEQQRRKMA